MIVVKRVYLPPAEEDGYRVLVDRLWPRGLTRAAIRIDSWEKELAPGTSLRLWFGHRSERWEEFKRRYRLELAAPERAACLDRLRQRARQERVTLLTAAHSDDENHALVLQQLLSEPPPS